AEQAARDEDPVPGLMAASALPKRGAELVRDYLLAGQAALGAVPTQRRVVAERFFDEGGGMQLVLHTPFGGRINRAWGMALRQRGRRVPPPIQRMRAQDLIAAVFPAQTACQDNHGMGAIEIPDHPLVRETVRDCLTEAMDLAGLRVVIADLRAGRIETLSRDV